ncbi:helix-turn-helix domain-containing protein [Devosia sp.]|uniref:MarR family winged helix-turn-helix transcriptional regulator n=1 Tax=Devosia sp. TaxID=1871048 RepID=UPI001AC4E5B3|nr:helix-turn-helix domain-containing protein [Devosia sp.]MBN9310058.1 MarR family transcriptional regulator [Devosia sp.]
MARSSEEEPMFDHKETLFHVASLLARQLSSGLREALVPFGLHPAQFTALSEIAQREGLTQAELVVRLDLEQPGVARTLAALEAEGWIEKSSLGKGRAQGLYLSARAREILPLAAQAAAEADRQAVASLSRTEAALLIDGLSELAAANRA